MGDDGRPDDDRSDDAAWVRARYAGYAADPERSRRWQSANAGNRAIADEVAAAVLPQASGGGLVLDVGCGTGWWLQRLRDAGHRPTALAGLDLLDHRVATARVRVPGADIRVGNATALPWPDGHANLVTLFLALSSMPADATRRAALVEARRVTARGGTIAAWEPRVPTRNPATQPVTRRLLRETLGVPAGVRSLTVAPPVARRLDERTYGRLARVPLFRTHRLVVFTKR